MMKALLSLTFLFAGLFTVKAQQYKPVDDKSEVKFTIKNFGINTPGSLNGLKGSIKFNPSDLVSSSFNVSVDVNTVNTGVDARDSHIKKEEYFNAEKFPVISFSSIKIIKEQDSYSVTGNLTIKGVTRSISFPFTVQNRDNGLIFSGSFTIDRKDFGVGGSSAVLGNNVDVSLKVFSVKG
jgi:polyisoprenoid-binding protein YceI